MKKKALSLALALAMCLGLTVPTFAAESDFTIENGVLTVYTGPGGDVVIPDGVTSIGETSFMDCVDVTSVIIPDSVTSIDSAAFAECVKMASVTIPNSVTSIAGGVFHGCASLTSVTIPDGITKIGFEMFRFCASLTSVTIPDSVTYIEVGAFQDCGSLKDVYYGGSEEQWKAVDVRDENDSLTGATIHYSGGTDTPAEPEKPLAKAGNQDIEIDGNKVAFQTYMLADANGNGTNYVKLRDIAHVLNGTKAQFSVGYNRQEQSISAATGAAYKDTGTEMDTPFAGADKEYVQSNLTIVVDGVPVQLDAITLMDDAGNGYNYFKLRDLGDALGFTVGYSRARGVYIETE